MDGVKRDGQWAEVLGSWTSGKTEQVILEVGLHSRQQQPCLCAQTCLGVRNSDCDGADIKVQIFRSCICFASNYCIWDCATSLFLMVNLQPSKAEDLKRSYWRCSKYYIGKQVSLPTNIQDSSACSGHISTWEVHCNCRIFSVLILIANYLISISPYTAASYHLMQ